MKIRHGDSAAFPLHDWRGRNVAVVGLGISNRALVRFLVARGAKVVGFDRKRPEAIADTVAEMDRLGVPVVAGEDYLERLEGDWDAVFLTPGIDRTQPLLRQLRASGTLISSEMELFFQLCPAPIVGVTGSSGKTTTTSLIARLLSGGDRPVWLGGNIGTPLIEQVESISPDSWVVVELSSFQLEFLNRSPHIGVVTNFTPNHLDVHPSLEAYWEAKARMFRFQRPSDWAVYNADDPEAARMAAVGAGQCLGFSRRRPLDVGAYRDGNEFIVRLPGRRPVAAAHAEDLRLPGEHNVENALAALLVSCLCGVEAGAARQALRSFTGVPHRLELVATVDGVRYVNDSIATSPARARAGLRSFTDPVVLIAGGYDKNLPFDPLVEAIAESNVRAVVLLGATADKIEAALQTLEDHRRPLIVRVDSLASAVREAHRIAQPGDVVLLSPACASYDMFRDFEERGRVFKELVAELAAVSPSSAASRVAPAP